MRFRRQNARRPAYVSYGRPDEYEDSFGSRNYRSSLNEGDGPYGSHYMPGDRYADDDPYYEEGRHYYSDRWYNEGEPFREELRDEYDRYGVGLSRGRYYGEPYGSVRNGMKRYRVDDRAYQRGGDHRDDGYRRHHDDDRHHDGFFHRAGERIRDTWHNLTHWGSHDRRDDRERQHERHRDDGRREGRPGHYAPRDRERSRSY
jgi:hypothetical protein